MSDWICLLLASSKTGQIALSWILEEVSACGSHLCCGDSKTDLALQSSAHSGSQKGDKASPDHSGKEEWLWCLDLLANISFPNIGFFRSSSDWAIAAHRREYSSLHQKHLLLLLGAWQKVSLCCSSPRLYWVRQIPRREGAFSYFHVKLFPVGFLTCGVYGRNLWPRDGRHLIWSPYRVTAVQDAAGSPGWPRTCAELFFPISCSYVHVCLCPLVLQKQPEALPTAEHLSSCV